MPGNLAYQAYQMIWTGLDWLYPPRCGGCDKTGERWCTDCSSSTELHRLPYCRVCGEVNHADLCPRCQDSLPAYAAMRSWSLFGGAIRSAIHRLKYYRDVGLGERLARPMIEELKKTDWPIQMVLPVPLSLARLEERGYNQASLLARPIALYFELPYPRQALKKVVNTRPQVGLTLKERQVNIQGAFEASSDIVKGKHILVVDDVTTTGSTLNACAQALLEAGAAQVFGYTLARAKFASSQDGQVV